MKEFGKHYATVLRKIRRARALVLLLDFDGTLSPIVSRPENSYLPAQTRSILKELLRALPICVITGRALRVIQKKADIRGLWYAASHGLEWNLGGTSSVHRVSRAALRDLADTRAKVRRLKTKYPQLINEYKPFAVTFHYHLLPKSELKSFARDTQALLEKIEGNPKLRMFRDKRTIDIAPSFRGEKGNAAKYVLHHLTKQAGIRFLPIYIGDSSPDEDAFRVLKRGITIRVGKTRESAAQYYFKSRREVPQFLRWLSTHYNRVGKVWHARDF